MALVVVFDVALAFDRKHVTCPKKPLAKSEIVRCDKRTFFQEFSFQEDFINYKNVDPYTSAVFIANRMVGCKRRKKYPATIYRSLVTMADVVIFAYSSLIYFFPTHGSNLSFFFLSFLPAHLLQPYIGCKSNLKTLYICKCALNQIR